MKLKGVKIRLFAVATSILSPCCVIEAFVPSLFSVNTVRYRQTTLHVKQQSTSQEDVLEGVGDTAIHSSAASAPPPPPPPIRSQEEKAALLPSKAKWKKKRFLMIKDVNAAISKRDPKAAQKAEHLVRRMWQFHEIAQELNDDDDGSSSTTSSNNNHMIDDYKPNTQVYNLWIHALAKSSSRSSNNKSNSKAQNNNNNNAGQRAEAVLQEMLDHDILPNVKTYASVMDAYANRARFDRQAPEHAERILFDLLEKSETTSSSASSSSSSSSDLQCTDITFDIALKAWSQLETREGAQRAQQLLERLQDMPTTNVRPTAHSYATVIHGWAQSGGGASAAQQAHNLLDRLLRMHDEKKQSPSQRGGKKKNNNDGDLVEPDTVIFNAVIDAWALSGDAQAGSKAVALLKQMQQLSDEEKDGFPCRPDVITYNSVLSAWSHCGHVNAALQAERILQDMILAHRESPDTAPAPNTVSYNSVLHAWSKSPLDGAAARAQAVLQYMIQSGNADIVPDVYSFSSVLNALAKSKEPGKAVRAQALLQQLLNMYKDDDNNDKRRPQQKSLTQVPFNAVLNAAAFSAMGTNVTEQRQALQAAVKTFSTMSSSSSSSNVKPDAVSYGLMFKCLANLMPSSSHTHHHQGSKKNSSNNNSSKSDRVRNEMALSILNKCCDQGYLGELAWNEVQRAVIPPRILSQHLNNKMDNNMMDPRSLARGDWTVFDLPMEWRRNTQGDQRMRQQSHSGKKRKRRYKNGSVQQQPEGAQQPKPMIRRPQSISEPSYQSGHDI